MTARQILSQDVRSRAAAIAATRAHPEHRSNGDEQRMRDDNGDPTYVGNFTKCLPHDANGFLLDPHDYTEWVRSIDSADPRDFVRLRMGPGPFQANGDFEYEAPNGGGTSTQAQALPKPRLAWRGTYEQSAGGSPDLRAWESQGAGSTFDLEGPDAQAVTMPPAPSLDSQELIAEMGELYWMALCRDVPFANWSSDDKVKAASQSLAKLWWFRADRTAELTGYSDRLPTSLARRRVLSQNGTDAVPEGVVFRGVSPGELVGPYLSQFLLIGNRGINGRDTAQDLADGQIAYGAIRIDQRVRQAKEGLDFLTDWDQFLDVQNGADTRGRETYEGSTYRFIATPRDLATYVHYDALYEAYLNACLILLALRAPFDPGLPFQRGDVHDRQQGFAQFGGPHILTLVTEVATRALKAVRYQKFNIHRRLRPEAIGGWMFQRRMNPTQVGDRLHALEGMEKAFLGSAGIGAALEQRPGGQEKNWLLPMAFPEGSPTHPAYGAGHATVAGACVTILKAWFDHGWPLVKDGESIAYQPDEDGAALLPVTVARPLTVEGELNKVAANIAIGRNFGGVHYYSDYYESFRMGEQVALGLLEEQKVTYGETFSFTVPLFDGTTVRI